MVRARASAIPHPPTNMLRIKRVYDPPSAEDGTRLLIMRKWPRGIRKDAVGAWDKELGPSLELLAEFRQGRVPWPEYVRRYTQEMRGKPELIRALADRAQQGTVTLLCGCAEEARCHRSLLKRLVEEAMPGSAHGLDADRRSGDPIRQRKAAGHDG